MLEQYDKKKIVTFIGIPLLVILLLVLVGLVTRAGQKKTLTDLEDKKALGVATDSTNTVYFDLATKNFIKISNNEPTQLMTLDFEPFSISYDQEYSKALLIGDINNPSKYFEVADFVDLKRYVLDPMIVSAQISPDGTKIVANLRDNQNKRSSLVLYDSKGVKIKDLGNLQYNEDSSYGLFWQNKDKILYMPILNERAEVAITQVDINTGRSSTLISSGPYLNLKISPDGKKVALLRYSLDEGDSQGSSLAIFDTVSEREITAGSIDKPVETSMMQAGWSSDSSMFYAITTNKGKNQIVKVDLDGLTNYISEYNGDLAIYQLVVSADQSELWVVTKSGLKKIKLK